MRGLPDAHECRLRLRDVHARDHAGDIHDGNQRRAGVGHFTGEYRPVGNWGLQFSSVGAVVYRRAKEQGLGRMLPTEWFLQDIKN